jgi:hypothetical protein
MNIAGKMKNLILEIVLLAFHLNVNTFYFQKIHNKNFYLHLLLIRKRIILLLVVALQLLLRLLLAQQRKYHVKNI